MIYVTKMSMIKNAAALYPYRSAIFPQQRPPKISPIPSGTQAL